MSGCKDLFTEASLETVLQFGDMMTKNTSLVLRYCISACCVCASPKSHPVVRSRLPPEVSPLRKATSEMRPVPPQSSRMSILDLCLVR